MSLALRVVFQQTLIRYGGADSQRAPSNFSATAVGIAIEGETIRELVVVPMTTLALRSFGRQRWMIPRVHEGNF